MNCVLCGTKIKGYGNNPWPLSNEGECCRNCNDTKVIPARIREHASHQCIFEKRYCRYAENKNNTFCCLAPSDEEMTCR